MSLYEKFLLLQSEYEGLLHETDTLEQYAKENRVLIEVIFKAMNEAEEECKKALGT